MNKQVACAAHGYVGFCPRCEHERWLQTKTLAEKVAERLRKVYGFAQPDREARAIEKLCREAAELLENRQKQVEHLRAEREQLREYIDKLQNLLHERGCCQWAIDRFIGDPP